MFLTIDLPLGRMEASSRGRKVNIPQIIAIRRTTDHQYRPMFLLPENDGPKRPVKGVAELKGKGCDLLVRCVSSLHTMLGKT